MTAEVEKGTFVPKTFVTSLHSPTIQCEDSADWNGRKVIPTDTLQPHQDQPEAESPISSLITLFKSVTFENPSYQILDHSQTSNGSFNIDEEIRTIHKLPLALQELIGSFIDPTEIIVEAIQQKKEILASLQHRFKDVTNLNLSNIKLQDSQTLLLLNRCKNIEKLKMPTRAGDQIDLTQFNHIIRSIGTLENLIYLDMSKWISSVPKDFLNDETIKTLVSSKKLEHLNLKGITLITDQGVSYIIEACENLKYLNLYCCEYVAYAVFHLTRQIPNFYYSGQGKWKKSCS